MIGKIIDIAKEAGKIILKCRKEGFETKTKKDDFDFLTTADLKSEELILKKLRKEFPNDMILSEETEDKQITNHSRVWMVDPLDGTKDFKNGGSGFSVMIGLCINGIPTLGVVFAPAKEILYYAEKGKGAFLEVRGKKVRLKVSDIKSLDNSRMVTRIAYGEIREGDKLIDYFKVKEKISESSVGTKLGLIASGKADLHIHTNFRANKWDTCAPQIILEEAGGKITDLSGSSLDYKKKENNWANSFVATNGKMHEKVIEKIKEFYSSKK